MTADRTLVTDRSVDADAVLGCLDEIIDPCSVASATPLSITEMGLIQSLTIQDGVITIAMRLTAPACLMVGFFKSEAADRIRRLPGITDMRMTFDAGLDWDPGMIAPAARERRARQLAVHMPLPIVAVRPGGGR